MQKYSKMKTKEEYLKFKEELELKELLSIINLKSESELLNQYLSENYKNLGFCVQHCEMPFNVQQFSTSVLIKIIEMIKKEQLIFNKDAKI